MSLQPVPTSRPFRRLTWLLLLALARHASAQNAAPASAATPDETVALSPFEVSTSRDTGYTAADSLAGSRTNMPLQYVPAAISVMTSQFLQDIAATDFLSSMTWAVNYTPDVGTVNTTGIGGTQVNYRNMGDSFYTRNYFIYYIDSDSFDVERYEIARGPNGVLFGDGGASGVATTFSKQAHFGNAAYDISNQVNSYGGDRLTADLNQPLGDTAALRLNLLDQNGQFDYRKYTHWNRQGADLATIFKLTPHDSLRVEGEAGAWNRSIIPDTVIDDGTLWNRTASYNGQTAIANATAAGVQAIPASSGEIYANGALSNWTNFYRSIGLAGSVNLLPTGANDPVFLHSAALPYKGFNLQPPDVVGNTHYYTYTAYLDHEVSDNLNLELAYNRQRQFRDGNGATADNAFNAYQIDVNTVLPDGAPNPDYGQPYSDSQPNKQVNANLVDDIRALANWKYQSDWLDESDSFIGGARLDRFHSHQEVLEELSNGSNIYVRRYWNQAGEDEGLLDIPGTGYVPTVETWQRKALDYAQVATLTQLFHDRLTLLAGVRYDNVTSSQVTISTPETVYKVSPVSKNVGAVYYVLPWIGPFANYSETFNPPTSGNALLNGSTPGISRSKGEDVGFNINLLDGKIAGSARYYESEQDDALVTGPDEANVNNIWNALNQPQNLISAYRDFSSTKGKGYEVELTGNPSPNLRFMFNIAFPTVAVISVDPQLQAYVKANLPEWQAAAATNPTVQSNLATITSALDGLVTGATSPGTYKYTANLLAAYTFHGLPLKDLTLGGGGNFRGPAVIGSYPGLPFDYVDTGAYYLLTAFASYERPVGQKMAFRVQLNVTNLLNSEHLIANAVTDITTPADLAPGASPLLLTNVRIPDPRMATLSAELDF